MWTPGDIAGGWSGASLGEARTDAGGGGNGEEGAHRPMEGKGLRSYFNYIKQFLE